MMRPFRRQNGFTLLEVLLAVGVLMLGSLGVMALFAIASESHRAAVEQAQTALAAETLLADYQSTCTPEWINQRLAEQVPQDWPVKLENQQSPEFPRYYYDLEIRTLDLTGDPADDTSELHVTLTLKSRDDDPNAVVASFETVYLLRPY